MAKLKKTRKTKRPKAIFLTRTRGRGLKPIKGTIKITSSTGVNKELKLRRGDIVHFNKNGNTSLRVQNRLEDKNEGKLIQVSRTKMVEPGLNDFDKIPRGRSVNQLGR